MTIVHRPRSKATLKAVEILTRLKDKPTRKQVEAAAARAGVHWATVYRALAAQQK